MFGGIGDAITAILLTQLNLIKYKNMGVFSAFGYFSIWTPLTWMFAFMIFFYFLPVRKAFLVPYVLAFALLNMVVGQVMSQFGLFEFIGIQKYLAPFIFVFWYSISAWSYFRIGHVALK